MKPSPSTAQWASITQPLWGDLLLDPVDNALILPVRSRTPSIIRLTPATDPADLFAPEAMYLNVKEARLRHIHPDGAWLITTPTDPMTLFAVDRDSGKIRWRFEVPGRFDPDTRLAIAVDRDGDADGTILVAGCGYPYLVRLDATGTLLLDYYALSEAHARDFAWRGVVSVAPGREGRVYLVDRNMYGAVLVIDSQTGHIADIGQRAPQTMSANPLGLQEPCWAIPDSEGGLWILELGVSKWSRYTSDGKPQEQLAIASKPAHYFDQEQGLRWGDALVTLARHKNQWTLVMSHILHG